MGEVIPFPIPENSNDANLMTSIETREIFTEIELEEIMQNVARRLVDDSYTMNKII